MLVNSFKYVTINTVPLQGGEALSVGSRIARVVAYCDMQMQRHLVFTACAVVGILANMLISRSALTDMLFTDEQPFRTALGVIGGWSVAMMLAIVTCLLAAIIQSGYDDSVGRKTRTVTACLTFVTCVLALILALVRLVA